MKKFLAITPYFGGVSSAPRQTELDNVLRYFEHTYSTLKPFMTKLIVGVYNDADYNTLRPFQLNFDMEVIRVTKENGDEIDPIFLPANLVRCIQQRGFDEEYVYFTEADQIVYAKDWNNVYNTIDNDKNIYLVPQRFEQIPNELIQARIDKYTDTTEGRFVEFDGVCRENNNKYVVANEPVGPIFEAMRTNGTEKIPANQVYNYDDHFYVCPSPQTNYIDAPEYGQAYGAAYLCHRDLFNRVKFIDARFEFIKNGKSFHIEYQPTETTAGHDLLRTEDAICLKSRDFFYFHVDHLSGYEWNKKL
tara:strand:+ start:922 stop:1833 length:912 start_codon:yes stop_codon:yes gene_type:complete